MKGNIYFVIFARSLLSSSCDHTHTHIARQRRVAQEHRTPENRVHMFSHLDDHKSGVVPSASKVRPLIISELISLRLAFTVAVRAAWREIYWCLTAVFHFGLGRRKRAPKQQNPKSENVVVVLIFLRGCIAIYLFFSSFFMKLSLKFIHI